MAFLCSDIPKDFSGGKADVHYYVSDILMLAPQLDAAKLLCDHWETLQYSPLMIFAALSVDTPQLTESVEETFQLIPESINVFEHFFIHLNMIGRKTDIHLLERLKPYIHRFDEHNIWRLAEACIHSGKAGIDWMYENMPEILEKHGRRQYYAPTLPDHIENLEHQSNEPFVMKKWFEAFEVYDFKDDPFVILEEWFQANPNWERFKKVALAIEMYGQRKHLSILDHLIERDFNWFVKDEKERLRFIVYRRTLT